MRYSRASLWRTTIKKSQKKVLAYKRERATVTIRLMHCTCQKNRFIARSGWWILCAHTHAHTCALVIDSISVASEWCSTTSTGQTVRVIFPPKKTCRFLKKIISSHETWINRIRNFYQRAFDFSQARILGNFGKLKIHSTGRNYRARARASSNHGGTRYGRRAH